MVHPYFLNLGSGEIFLVVVFIILFFGADKLPEMARAFGRGMRDMKNAAGEIQKEIQNSAADIQRDMNMQGQLDELKGAADNMTRRIMEGVNAGDESKKTDAPELPEPPEEEDNQHKPDESIKR